MSRSVGLVCLGVLLVGVGAACASMSYEANQSMVGADYIYQITDSKVAMHDALQYASGFGPMNLSASTAYQTFLSGSAQLTGTFAADQATAAASLTVTNNCAEQWGPGSGGAGASALWDLTFELGEAQAWSLTGTTGANLQGSYIALYGYDTNNDTFNVFFQDIGFAASTQTINVGSELDAGRYWLYVQGRAWTNVPYNTVTSGYDLTFSVAEVPEPATMILLALGGLPLLRRRR